MSGIKDLLRSAARQPLLQFAVLGALLFLLLDGGRGRPDESVIVVDPPLRERLSMLYEAQLGTWPSPEEMAALVERHVREEMLYREALRLGLDRGDEIVRRRLVQKMEFLAVREGAPGEAALRAFFDEDPARFGVPPQASFRQLYFNPDEGGWEAAKTRAAAALASGSPRGERFVLQDEYTLLGPQDASQTFGDSEFAKHLFAAPPGEWSGPFRSGYGWHLLFLRERTEAEVPEFEAVADQVALAWAEDNRMRQVDELVTELREHYRVEERK